MVGTMRHNFKNWLKFLQISENGQDLPIREIDIEDISCFWFCSGSKRLYQRYFLVSDFAAGASGCIINTCGWVTGSGFKRLLHIVEAFKGKY